MLTFTLLGRVLLEQNGETLTHFRSQKEAALLIYLAHTRQTHSREFIAEFLWQSRTTKQSLSNLRTAISRLRKQVGEALVVTRKTIALTPESQRQVDTAVLQQTLASIGTVNSSQAATQLQNALAAYQGDFLADFHLANAPAFNEWVMVTREQIRRQVVAAFEKLGSYAQAQQNVPGGIAIAQRWLEVDELNETAHMLLVELLLSAGNVGEAVTQYDKSSTLLRTELGIQLPTKLTVLVEKARLSQPLTAVPARAPAQIRHNLPAAYDQFFGRQAVQQEIHVRLDQPWCRLVTLTGQGGVGKTRLALTLARSRLRQYPDGIWLIELADLEPEDEELTETIAVEIAIALDLRLTGEATPIEQLLDYLQHKQMLIILDNFELLFGGIEIVKQITYHCNLVQLIVTSRESLQLRAEWTVPLTGLNFSANDTEEVVSEAVTLFMARQAQQRWEAVSAEEQTAVRTICRMVEGLPLAIELAAALTQHISLHGIVESLADGFDALETTFRDMPGRHRALSVVFEMSWETLTPALQQRLARLAFFRGGFTEEAAETVAEAATNHLSRLVEKSLLTQLPALKRYRLHPVIRAYAGEKRPFADPTPSKHSHYFLTMLAQHAESLQKKRPQNSMAVLEPDIDNIRLAWQTGLNEQSHALLLPALPSLSIYYQLRGLAREGEAMMQTSVKNASAWETAGVPLATRAGLERARFQNRLGQYRPAIRTIQSATKLASKISNHWVKAMAHIWWGESLWRLGEYKSAKSKINLALNIANNISSELLTGHCHHHLGIINDIQSNYSTAQNHLEKACEAWQTLENNQALSISLNSIGLVKYHKGDLAGAKEALEQALVMCTQLDNRHLQSPLLNNLSIISTEQGDFEGAQYYLQLSFELAKTSGNLATQGEILTNIGRNYHHMGEIDLATSNLEKGLKISESIGSRSAMATALYNLAEIGREGKNFDQAKSLYNRAYEIAKENNLLHTACEALIGLAELMNDKNDRQAKNYSTEAINLANSIQNPHLYERANAIYSTLLMTENDNKLK